MDEMTQPTVDPTDLKRAGLKVTLPRIRVLEVLEGHPQQHFSAEDVYRELMNQGRDLGLATIYRVLTQFEQAQIIKRHQFEGGKSVFELVAKGAHDHIVCLESGYVEEFRDPVIESRLRAIADQCGFDFSDYALVVYGVRREGAGEPRGVFEANGPGLEVPE